LLNLELFWWGERERVAQSDIWPIGFELGWKQACPEEY
jgi:hypothetical protein